MQLLRLRQGDRGRGIGKELLVVLAQRPGLGEGRRDPVLGLFERERRQLGEDFNGDHTAFPFARPKAVERIIRVQSGRGKFLLAFLKSAQYYYRPNNH